MTFVGLGGHFNLALQYKILDNNLLLLGLRGGDPPIRAHGALARPPPPQYLMWGAQLYSEPHQKIWLSPSTLYEDLTHEFAHLFLVSLILCTYTYMGSPTWPAHAHASRIRGAWCTGYIILYVEVATRSPSRSSIPGIDLGLFHHCHFLFFDFVQCLRISIH